MYGKAKSHLLRIVTSLWILENTFSILSDIIEQNSADIFSNITRDDFKKLIKDKHISSFIFHGKAIS